MSLVNFTGRHRLTPKTRAARVWTQVRLLSIPDVLAFTFWGALVAAAGFIAGWVWAQVVAL